MSTTELDVARQRMNTALAASDYAQQKANEALAEVARLTLLKLAAEYPTLEGITFEAEYQYDDEGGYFKTVSVYPAFEEGSEEEYDDFYEFSDPLESFGPRALATLCGVDADSFSGQITIAEAKTKRF